MAEDESKTVAVLAYIIIGIVWYLVDEKMHKNKFVQFHVRQAILVIGLSFAVAILGLVIPVLGALVILPIGQLIVFVMWLIGIYYAITAKKKEIPVIGRYANKIKV